MIEYVPQFISTLWLYSLCFLADDACPPLFSREHLSFADLLNILAGIADTIATVSNICHNRGENHMDGVWGIDTVLKHVQQAARRLSLSTNAPLTQQILLISDAFYGYRFASTDFTAVWASSDQTLKMYDGHGRELEVISLMKEFEEPCAVSLSIGTSASAPLHRKAA